MKRHWMIALVMACAATVAFAGCGGDEPDNTDDTDNTGELTLAKVRELYGTVSQATKVEESIEIKSGALVQYSEEKVYALAGDAYTVTGSTKRLNGLDASTAYTETTIEAYTVNRAEAFTGVIGLEDTHVESVAVNGGTLTVSVKAGSEKDFFKLQTPSELSGMKAVFRTNETTLGGIEVTYTSGLSTVTVTINFTY